MSQDPAAEQEGLEEIVVRERPDRESLDLLIRTRLPRRSLVRVFWLRFQSRFTPGGRSLVLVLLGAGGSGLAFGIQYPVYLFGLFLLCLMGVAELCGRMFLPRATIERRLPERCAAGATVVVPARITHTGRLPAFDLALREASQPPMPGETELEYLDHLRAGESAELSYTIQPYRRGAYQFPGPELVTCFPFGMYNAAKTHKSPKRMLVYPRFTPLRSITLPAGRKHQPGGLQLVSHVGDSEEFVGNREYRPGDRLRDIHHAAWARVGFPVVREFEQEYLTRIALVVDTFVPRANARGTRCMEGVISLGAAVADALSRKEYVVDVFAAGPELYHFQAGRSLAYLDNILDVLACVEECRDDDPFPKLAPAVMTELEQISTAVLIFLDWDESRLGFTRRIQERGVEAKVVVVREGQPSLDPSAFTSAAGAIKLFTPQQVDEGVGDL